MRCFGDGDPLYEAYHDDEWGVAVHGDRALFERIALEGFQSGLSWITVLRKRPVEYFLPFRDEVLGKISNAFPRFFLSQLDKARLRGKRNFSSPDYRQEP